MISIRIEKTKESDLDSIVLLENVPENQSCIIPVSKSEHIILLQDDNIEYLNFRTPDGKFIGFAILAGLLRVDKNMEFRRIIMAEKNKGYGKIAIEKIIELCFGSLRCHRLWLDVLEHNSRAIHVYTRLGFVQEAKLRDGIFMQNSFHDLVIMSILHQEYKTKIMANGFDKMPV